MTGAVRQLAGQAVFVCADMGPPLAAERDAVDLIGELYGTEARFIALPTARLGAEFLALRSRVAGEVLQKFVTYGFRVAIVGDIEAAVAASDALRDFVRESNRGKTVWFVPDLDALAAKLAADG
jgi:hypothetical protein